MIVVQKNLISFPATAARWFTATEVPQQITHPSELVFAIALTVTKLEIELL
jgi:hypothetical protein